MLFVAKLDTEKKQKLLKLREQGKKKSIIRAEQLQNEKEVKDGVQGELNFDNFAPYEYDNYIPPVYKEAIETELLLKQQQSSQNQGLKRQRNNLKKKKQQAMTARSNTLTENGIANILNDRGMQSMFRTMSDGFTS